MSVKERRSSDRAFERAVAALKRGPVVTVGIHEQEGAKAHDPKSGATVAELGAIHEYGAPAAGVPQRSYVRSYVDATDDATVASIQRELRAALDGKQTVNRALKRVALALEGGVKRQISRGIPPPLKPETIRRKGSSKPLIDTGLLRASIKGRVGFDGGSSESA